MVSVLKPECSVIKEHRQKGNGRCLRNPGKWGMVRDRGLSHRFLGVEGILVLFSEFQLCPVIKSYIVLIYNHRTCQGQCVCVCVHMHAIFSTSSTITCLSGKIDSCFCGQLL